VTKRRSPLAFLGKLKADDWRRALILAQILGPPLARQVGPRRKVAGNDDEELPRRPL
jgi:hypothetical protein